MKKMLIVALIVAAGLVLVSGQSFAAICSDCHTMHNSQNGAAATYDGSTTPNAVLLKGTCLGCHTTTASAVNGLNAQGVPQVKHAGTDNLAGGNFNLMASTDANGHNVLDVDTDDANIPGTDVPPGSSVGLGGQLTCAGTNGCHGNRTTTVQLADLSGAHHANTTGEATGAALGSSYRFLKSVKGYEVSTWRNTSATAHNEYYADGTAAPAFRATTAAGITGFCESCHSDFHSTTGTTGAWTRHPADTLLNNGGTAIPTKYTTTYKFDMPLARSAAPSTISDTVAGTADKVMCLTCHQAHATANADILRFALPNVGDATGGCNNCHTN